MSPRIRIFIGIAGVLLVVAVASFIFFRYLLLKSFPVVDGTLPLRGLTSPVRVIRDDFGVPRIEALSEHDAIIALGYVHAQDRLWQMDLQRRAAQGRLSEIFGSTTVQFDKMFRIVGLRRACERTEATLSAGSRARLEWYAEGVNQYIEAAHGSYPVEFDMLGYDPEPWTPLHSLLVSRLLAWELSLSWWTDVTYGTIADRVGMEKTQEILPTYPSGVAPTVGHDQWRQGLAAGKPLLDAGKEYLAFSGLPLPASGSNAFAVAGSRTVSGKPILANDTHLRLTAPGQWYEAGLYSPECSVRGMTIPGVPVVVAGRNDDVAWGVTNAMADDADFYIERLDSIDGRTYLSNGSWKPVTILEEEIQVRGDTLVPLLIRQTENGPIVTDIRTPLTASHPSFVASMRWTGAEPDDMLEALAKVNHATDWASFTEGLRLFTAPGQNFVYADRAGNIGYYCALRLPIRGASSGLFPQPGWEPGHAWKGYVPFESLPHELNPPNGFVASANNKIVDDAYPWPIGYLWEPPSRIQRLREVLGTPGWTYAPQDIERLQTDAVSPLAKEMVPLILQAFRDSVMNTGIDNLVTTYLTNWNYSFTKSDIASTIYHHFLVRLIRNIYADEMGEDLFRDFTILVNVPLRVTTRVLHEGTSTWFDDIRTPEVETRDDIIRKSLREAIRELRASRTDETRRWRWGDEHTVTQMHPFGIRRPLDLVFNIGPYPADGASTALVSGEYSLTEPFTVTVGPSYRYVMDLSNGDEYRAIVPGGQSGQVYHEHYADQTPLWLNGSYRTVQRHPAGEKNRTLLLTPAP